MLCCSGRCQAPCCGACSGHYGVLLAATLASCLSSNDEGAPGGRHSCAVAGWAQVGHDNNVMVEVVEEHYS